MIRRDRLLRHRRAVDLGEVRRDLPGGQALAHTATARSHRPRSAGAAVSSRSAARTCRPGPGAHRSRPGRWHRSAPSSAGSRCGCCSTPCPPGQVLVMAQVLGHLLVQRGLQHRLGELLQQPVRAGQGQALLLGQPDQLPGRNLLSRGLRLLLLRSHRSVSWSSRHLPRRACAQRVGPETPLDPQSLLKRRGLTSEAKVRVQADAGVCRFVDRIVM